MISVWHGKIENMVGSGVDWYADFSWGAKFEPSLNWNKQRHYRNEQKNAHKTCKKYENPAKLISV